MSQENVETLRRAYEAFSRGDLDAAVADADPDVEYIQGIDSAEIINAVHARRPPMMPASAGLCL